MSLLNSNISRQRSHVYLGYGLAVLTIGIGLYSRLKGLGVAPFANDEYLIAQATQAVLEHGIPSLGCDRFYLRGLLYQYLLAFSALLGFDGESGYRFVTVVLNIMALPAVYILAGKIGGRTVGIAAVMLFSLSLTEIETARYVRMYVPFQTLFLWYMLLFYMVVCEHREKYRGWMYTLTVISVLIYEGAVFLVVLNFVALLNASLKNRFKDLVIASLVFIAVFGIVKIEKTLISGDPGAQAVAAHAVSKSIIKLPIDAPHLFVATVQTHSIWFYLAAALVLLNVLASYRLLKPNPFGLKLSVALIAVIWCGFFNALALAAAIACIVYLMGYLTHKHLRIKGLYGIAALVGLQSVFWLLFALSTNAWHGFFEPSDSVGLKKLLVMFLKYPDFYTKIIYQWTSALPVTSVGIALTLFVGTVFSVFKLSARSLSLRYMLAVVVLLCLVTAMLRQPYLSTKYTFFMYPLLLILFVGYLWFVVKNITQWNGSAPLWVFAAMLVVSLLMFEDTDWYHLTHIDKKSVVYRQRYDLNRAYHYHYRFDYRTPAVQVNVSRGENDAVIVTDHVLSYYLDHLDFVFLNADKAAAHLFACGGKKEMWSNAGIIGPNDLYHFIDSRKTTTWLLAKSDKFFYQSGDEKSMSDKYSRFVYYTSIDGAINVYKIPPRRQ